MGRHLLKGVSENHSKARFFGSVQWLHIIRCPQKKGQGSTNLVRKFYLEYSLDMHWVRREFGTETFWSRTLRCWEHLDTSSSKSRNAAVKLSGRDRVFETSTFRREYPARGDELGGDLRGESDGSQPLYTATDDSVARSDFWSIEGIYTCRHRVEPRVKLKCDERRIIHNFAREPHRRLLER